MAEGLGLSFFVLFIVELYLYVITGQKRHAAGAMVLYLIVKKRKLLKTEQQIQGVIEYQDRIEQIGHSLIFVFIVMTGIAVNSVAVGVTIFTQPRYMLYNMGLFYTAGCMLLYDIISLRMASNGR
ncbi:MAG: hypothetical protein HFI50_16090 [Lachnospiraceae bacterium]|nr:hypothetical protein [Lachnospiraceae bacterium]